MMRAYGMRKGDWSRRLLDGSVCPCCRGHELNHEGRKAAKRRARRDGRKELGG